MRVIVKVPPSDDGSNAGSVMRLREAAATLAAFTQRKTPH